jgi:mannosyltransferase
VQPVYTFRYIVFCIPATALLLGAGLAAVGRTAACAGLVLITVLGLPAQLSEREALGHGDGLRQLDQIISVRARPGDVLVYPGDGGLRTFAAAYRYGLGTLPDITLGSTPARSGSIGGINAPVALIHSRLTGATRVWVPEMLRSRPSAPVPALRGLPFRLVSTWDLGDNIWLALFARY